MQPGIFVYISIARPSGLALALQHPILLHRSAAGFSPSQHPLDPSFSPFVALTVFNPMSLASLERRDNGAVITKWASPDFSPATAEATGVAETLRRVLTPTLTLPARFEPQSLLESPEDEDHHDGSTVFDDDDVCHHSEVAQFPREQPRNTIRLFKTSGCASTSPLRAECIVRSPGAFHKLSGPEDQAGGIGAVQANPATMEEILRPDACRIVSMLLDVSSFPNPDAAHTLAPPIVLPFPFITASDDPKHRNGGVIPAPLLPELTDLHIITSRALSCHSLLQLLRSAPTLRSLRIENSGCHLAVYPEDCSALPTVDLPYLRSVSLRGISASSVDNILSRLILHKARVEVHLQPACPSDNPLSLRTLFSSVHHALLSYSALGRGGRDGRDRYLLTLSDIDNRVQLHWDWTVSHGDLPNLLHIMLDSVALGGVRRLTVSQRNVVLSPSDWTVILKPFTSLRRVDLHVTQAEDSHAVGPSPLGIAYRTATFQIRAAPLLKKVTDLPRLLALGFTHHFDSRREVVAGDSTPSNFGSSFANKLYQCTWKHMVRKSHQ
ncbi:hypothetical protein C8Q70DRAFT_1030870 [Cubamyces menziesii]|nr:hypothetical protein C8Q70DRAFT_1030870 [Cubamyces menziesii]